MRLMEEKLNWEYYGGHHHDNNYTIFLQSKYFIEKFGIDKRLRELSALILSKQISRNSALEILKNPYKVDNDLINFTLNKLDFSVKEFDEIMKNDNKTYLDYNTYIDVIKMFSM